MSIDWESLKTWVQSALGLLNQSLFRIGDFNVSLMAVVHVLFLLTLLYFASNQIRKVLLKKLTRFPHSKVDTVLTLLHYAVLAIGSTVILQSAGLDLGALAVLAGAVGLGLGLGLQNITNNFVSGLIILFEQPIKVGDRIELGQIMGQVMRIGLRSTTILTNDNISMIVPNSEFVSRNVINWNHTDDIVRLRIPIGVSYNADPKQVVTTLEAAINQLPGVLKDRKSDVILDSFGDSSVNFLVRVWTRDFSQKPGAMRHEINMAIWDALKENKIEIPFPQLDLHVRSASGLGPLSVSEGEGVKI